MTGTSDLELVNDLIADPSVAGVVTISDTALVLDPDMHLQDWVALGSRIIRTQTAGAWWIGDWLIHGDLQYGDKRTLADVSGLEAGYMNKAQWVALRFPPDRRRRDLSWSHHEEVAVFETHVQDRLLDLAVLNGWTRNELRAQAREIKRLAVMKANGHDEQTTGRPVFGVVRMELRLPEDTVDAAREWLQSQIDDLLDEMRNRGWPVDGITIL